MGTPSRGQEEGERYHSDQTDDLKVAPKVTSDTLTAQQSHRQTKTLQRRRHRHRGSRSQVWRATSELGLISVRWDAITLD